MAPGPQKSVRKAARRSSPALQAFIALTAFSILGTTASALTGLDPGPIRPVAAFLTLAAGCAAVAALAAQLLGPAKAATGLLALLLTGAVAEVLGLYTAIPFGPYEYTGKWAPSVLLPEGKTFPILLPFAWVMIVGASILACWPILRSWVALPAGAALAALVDLVMEPVMVGPLAYWRWLSPPTFFEAPWVNSLGWILTGTVGSALLVHNLAQSNPANPRQTKASHLTVAAYATLVLALHLALMLTLALAHTPIHPSTPALAAVLVGTTLAARALLQKAKHTTTTPVALHSDADKLTETSVEVHG